ncbi:hypothetical protein DFR29_113183 [Tahibacter aquaticus]|uniref:Uncharacterized protein n=1 Tax=Tahibacter aquaticus TaxID=520092 RepID=A0A4R6YR51_9GAMM|nr:hypothetical protein DFR29_113183 [Tahibacter aquaticus]
MPLPITPESHEALHSLNVEVASLPGFDRRAVWSPGRRPMPSVDHYLGLFELTDRASAVLRAALAPDSSGAGAAAALASMAPKSEKHHPRTIFRRNAPSCVGSWRSTSLLMRHAAAYAGGSHESRSKADTGCACTGDGTRHPRRLTGPRETAASRHAGKGRTAGTCPQGSFSPPTGLVRGREPGWPRDWSAAEILGLLLEGKERTGDSPTMRLGMRQRGEQQFQQRASKRRLTL